jgi:hypothetical protein
MADQITLGPDEAVPGKPFTDPENSRRDEAALRRLLEHERERARVWSDAEDRTESALINETDADGLRHLLVVPNTRALVEARDLTVVGFFGRPREDADEPLLFELESKLVAGMHEYGPHGLLSYYDLELVKGAYGNLILFSGPQGPEAWRENPVHQHAVEVSPPNYYEIRLHVGKLPGPFLDGGTLHLTRTRYLDYRDGEVWRAVRQLEPS